MLPDSDNGSRFFFLFPLYCLIDVRDAGGTQMVILRRNIPTCLPLYNQANIGQRDCPCLQIVWQPSRRRTAIISVNNYISLVINNINAFLRVVGNKIAPNLFAVKLPDECCPLKVQQRNG